MATFNADILDGMHVDLTPWKVDVQGDIPEPSSDQMATFLEIIRQIVPFTTDADGNNVLDLAALQEKFGDEDTAAAEAETEINAAIAAVCSDFPNAEQIKALPFRAKQAFYGWILGTLLSPEA